MKVKINAMSNKKKRFIKGTIDRKAVTSGLARRRQKPNLQSEIKVTDRNNRKIITTLAHLHDETGRRIGNDFLQQAIDKREALTNKQLTMFKELDVAVAFDVELMVKAQKRTFATPGNDIDIILTVSCFEKGKKARYRSILTDGEYRKWEVKNSGWRYCKKPKLDNQELVDSTVEEFMASLGGAP